MSIEIHETGYPLEYKMGPTIFLPIEIWWSILPLKWVRDGLNGYWCNLELSDENGMFYEQEVCQRDGSWAVIEFIENNRWHTDYFGEIKIG